MRRRPFEGQDTFRAALSSKRTPVPRWEQRKTPATTQQIGLESSGLSYIVVLAESRGEWKFFVTGAAYFLTPAIDKVAIRQNRRTGA
jgi:hypothetical protein